MFRVWVALGVGSLATTLTSGLFAQDASAAFPDQAAPPIPKPAPLPPASAPDVVRLKDGGRLRGAIAEMVPGDFVLIVLLTGEKRRIPFDLVDYAGPSDGETKANALAPPTVSRERPLIAVEGAAARVRFVSETKQVTLYRRGYAASDDRNVRTVRGYDELCTAPCALTLPAGTYTFAVSPPDVRPLVLRPLEIPAGESTLKANYESHRGVRVAIALASATFAGIGTATMIAGLVSARQRDTLLLSGAVLTLAGTVGFFTMSAFKDEVQLTLTPGSPRAFGSLMSERGPLDGLSGLTLTARF